MTEQTRKLLNECYDILAQVLEIAEEKQDAAKMCRHYRKFGMWAGVRRERDRLDRCRQKARALKKRLDRLEILARLL